MGQNKKSNIQVIRELRGLSRKEVAELSGINLRSLQDYEQGHKDISSAKADTLYRLSLTLDCSMEELLSETVFDIEEFRKKEFEKRLRSYQKNMELQSKKKVQTIPYSSEDSERAYYLMHRNDIVASMTFDEETGKIQKVKEIVNPELLPPGTSQSVKELVRWWERRAVPLAQGNIKQFLRENQIPTTQNYLLRNLGLSLSDHYWINPADACCLWEEVNLFTNDFSDEIGEFRFQDSISDEKKIIDLKKRTVFYPSASLQGELQKKWIVQNGRRFLIKGNYGNSCQQSINEVIATLLHQKQGRMPYTVYKLCDIQIAGDYGIGCVCEDFCTADIEFIPAYDIVNSEKKRNDISEYEHFISICSKNGLPEQEVRKFLEYQILSDFVITNTDRHFYNFGVLRDTHSLKYIGMAPIFDSENSLFWDKNKIPEGDKLLNVPVNSFKGKETELLRYVTDSSLVHIEDLPAEEEIAALLKLNISDESRIEAIIKGYVGKIGCLERLQNGEKIYQYRK